MKESIAFIVSDFDIGGITTSLRNLTDVLIGEGHRVGIANLPKADNLPADFNPDIELISLQGKALYWSMNISDIRHAVMWKKPLLLFFAVLKKILNKFGRWYDFIFSDIQITGYDVAIAFRQSPLCYDFAGKHVNANRRIGFWHGCPENLTGVDNWIGALNNVDYVACVSRAVENSMRDMYPRFAERYRTVYNIFNADEILEKSKQYDVEYCTDVTNLITVARIEYSQKQLQFIPQIAKRLMAKSREFQWTIVGDGPDFFNLQHLIKELQVDGCVHCVGTKPNPFPYVAKADLFVNTSILEAYGMVITEALILGTPCVAGDYPALSEIISNGENGIIAENSIEGITEAIDTILADKEKLEVLKRNAKSHRYSHKDTYQMFMELCQ